jgi:hypothetical protein
MLLKISPLFFVAIFIMQLVACQKRANGLSNSGSGFNPIPVRIQVNPVIDEASGIAESRKNAVFLWVQQDSGNPNNVSLLGKNGSLFKNVFIKGIINRDWEDMALSNRT